MMTILWNWWLKVWVTSVVCVIASKWLLDKENQKLESDLARYELRQQELDNEVKMLSNLGQEIHEVGFMNWCHG